MNGKDHLRKRGMIDDARITEVEERVERDVQQAIDFA